MIAFLKLIRWKNLLFIVIAQLLVKYALFEPFPVLTTMDTVEISLLIFATVCIAAAGNVINDIQDVETDTINRPERVLVGKSISLRIAHISFNILNILGVFTGFYLSHRIGSNTFFSFFVMISLALYVYATYLKGTVLIGNILVSLLVAMSIIIVAIFDLVPTIIPENRETQMTFFGIVIDYAVFAFLVNLVREMIKDIEDVDGDYNTGLKTLPIVLGRDRATKIAFIVSVFPIAAVIYFMMTYLYKQPVVIVYFLLAIIAPLIFATIKTFNAEHKKDYRLLSHIYKLVLFTGLLSLVFYPIILK